MRCLYCISEIHDDALVCPICRRDLYLVKPLLSRIEALEKTVATLQEARALADEPAIKTTTEVPEAAALQAESEPIATTHLSTWLIYWLTPLALLVAAHGLITVVYDLNTFYLRIVSLLIPLPFGLLLVAQERRPQSLLVAMAISLSGIAVLAMSGVTSIVDGTRILPAGLREWREFFEYAASIALSYASSMIVGRMSRLKARTQARQAAGASLALARLVSSGAAKTEQIQTVAKKFNDLGSSLTAAATTAAAVYAGLQGFVGR